MCSSKTLLTSQNLEEFEESLNFKALVILGTESVNIELRERGVSPVKTKAERGSAGGVVGGAGPATAYWSAHDEDIHPMEALHRPSVGRRDTADVSGSEEPAEPTFNLRLIEAVKHSRCLYDSTDRQYRNADYKQKVWNRLVQVLGFEGDARTLYNRWKQLRDKYGKEKKKIKYNGETTNWQYFKYLEFLDSHMIDRQQQKFTPRTTKDGKQYIPPDVVVISDPMFFSNLIEEVRHQPCLFDIRDPKYRHAEWRNQAWTEIAKNLNFHGDVSAIYKQWKKLRDRYVREKRRMRMQQQAGALVEESTWDLFQNMTWMDPYLDERANYASRFSDHGKRKLDPEDFSDGEFFDENEQELSARSDMQYVIMDSGGAKRRRILPLQAQRGDVLLDGDSAYAASVVSDWRSLPEDRRTLVKQQIMDFLSGMSQSPQIQFVAK